MSTTEPETALINLNVFSNLCLTMGEKYHRLGIISRIYHA